MATTDNTIIVQRPLALFVYKLKKQYNLTYGQSERQFMALYDLGEIQLSTCIENLFVVVRNEFELPTKKASADRYDFVKLKYKKETPLGDMKSTVLMKNGINRRFVIASVQNKIGYIYALCWNWMTGEPNFFAIPPNPAKFGTNHPKEGYKIPVCRKTGKRTGGWYNDYCAVDSFEELVQIG